MFNVRLCHQILLLHKSMHIIWITAQKGEAFWVTLVAIARHRFRCKKGDFRPASAIYTNLRHIRVVLYDFALKE